MPETISKTMIIEEVATFLDDTKLSPLMVEAVINATILKIVENVSNGNKVLFQDFGSWKSRQRNARIGRNPKTQEPMEIPATTVPVFSAGKGFKKTVAQK